jgi:acyl-CoA thioester hydrolase
MVNRHVLYRQMRFADIDSLGHVNNVRFFDYLEDARMAMLYLDPVKEGGESHRGLVVARHEIDYMRPLTFRAEPVRVETWVTDLGVAKFGLAYEIRDDAEVFVRAHSVLVAYDVASARPRRLTENEVTYLKRFMPEP